MELRETANSITRPSRESKLQRRLPSQDLPFGYKSITSHSKAELEKLAGQLEERLEMS